MWTTYSDVLIVPPLRRWTLTVLDPPDRLLPVRPFKDTPALAVWRKDFTSRKDCRTLQILSSAGIEQLCIWCHNSIPCSLAAVPGLKFTPRCPLEIGWTSNEDRALRETLEIPCLAALPHDQWDRREFRSDMAFSFDREQVLDGLTRLRHASFDALLDRTCMCQFIAGTLFRPRNTSGLQESFLQRLDDIERRIRTVPLPLYAEKIELSEDL